MALRCNSTIDQLHRSQRLLRAKPDIAEILLSAQDDDVNDVRPSRPHARGFPDSTCGEVAVETQRAENVVKESVGFETIPTAAGLADDFPVEVEGVEVDDSVPGIMLDEILEGDADDLVFVQRC